MVCNSAKAIIQTYPCKHRVLCRRCFVRTLQVAVNDLNLPLRCVVCRTRIQTLDRERFIGPSLDHQSNGLNQDREHHEASGLTTDTERHEVHGLTSDGGFHEEPGLELNREHQDEHIVDANEFEHLVWPWGCLICVKQYSLAHLNLVNITGFCINLHQCTTFKKSCHKVWREREVEERKWLSDKVDEYELKS